MAGNRALVVGVANVASVVAAGEEPSLESPGWAPLLFVHELVPRIEQALRKLPYDITTLMDPTREALVGAITEGIQGPTGCLVIHVVSHGQPGEDRTRVDVVPACGTIGIGTNVSDWVSTAQQRGRPALFLLDLCRSGRAARLPFLLERAGWDTYAWVISGAGPEEDGFDGRFSEAVADMLERLSRDGLGADPSRKYVSFAAFARRIAASVEAMPGLPQRVRATPLDPALAEPVLPFFPNPRYVDDPQRRQREALEPPLRSFLDDLDDVFDAEHFLGRVGSHFAGRRRQLRALSPWLDGIAPDAGPLQVVTGSPGVGKSALLGAMVCAAHPRLADAVPQVRARLDPSDCPSRNDALAAIHARQRGLDDLLASLGRQLHLTGPEDGWTVPALINELHALPSPPAIVVDALDEAVDPVGVLAVLLLPLVQTVRADGGPTCRLLVGMRPWSEFSALTELAARRRGLVDLDDTSASELRTDLYQHLVARLADLPAYATASQRPVRERLASAIANRLTPHSRPAGWGAFLVAGVFICSLESMPASTTVAAAEALGATVPVTLPGVLELDLRIRPDGVRLRGLLAALAHGKGEGMPEEIAGPLAVAFAPDVTHDDIAPLLSAALFYLRTGVDSDGTTLYRLFHHGVTDHLRRHPVLPATGQRIPTPPDVADVRSYAGLVLDHLLAARTVAGDTEQRRWRSAAPYLRRHAIQHAAEAGRVDELLTDPEYLVYAEPAGLISELDRAVTEDARLAAAVYRASSGVHRHADPETRRRLLAIDATRYGRADMARGFTGDPTVGGRCGPRWATGSQVTPALLVTLTGHVGPVAALATTTVSDRPVAVSGGEDGTVRMWDLTSRQPIGCPAAGHAGAVWAAATALVSGRPTVVTGGPDGTVRMWDATSGQPIGTPMTGHAGAVWAATTATMVGRPVAVTGGADGTVRLWDLHTCRPIGAPLTGHVGRIDAVVTAAILGRPVAVTGGEDGTVRVWEVFSGQPVGTPLRGHTGAVWAVATTTVANRPVAITGGEDGTVRVWDVFSGQPVGTPLRGHTGAVWAVATTTVANRPVAITGGEDGTVRVWDIAEGQPAGDPLCGHSGAVWAVAATTVAGRPVAISGGRDETVRVWDISVSRPVGSAVTGHGGTVWAVATTTVAGRPAAVTGGEDATVRVWDLTTGTPIGTSLGDVHNGPVWAVATTTVNNRTTAVTGHGDGAARLWDLTTGEPIGTRLTGHSGAVWAVATTTVAGRPAAVTGGEDATVRVWDLTTGTPIGTSLGDVHNGPVWAVATTTVNNRTTAVTGHGDGAARLWDLTTGEPVATRLTGHSSAVMAVAVTTVNGVAVAITGGEDATVRVWDLTTSYPIGAPLTGHTGAVTAVAAVTITGRPVAVSAGEDRTVRLWDIRTMACLDVVPCPTAVNALVVAEGAIVICADREILVLDLVIEEIA